MVTEAKMHDVFGGFSLDMARYEFRCGGVSGMRKWRKTVDLKIRTRNGWIRMPPD